MSSLQASDAYPPFLTLIRDGVRAAVDAGSLGAAEADAMTVSTYQRTREDIEAPFADGGLGLVVDEHTSFVTPDPAHAALTANGDVGRFADDEVAQIRGWSGPSLAAAIDPDRGPGGVAATTDAVFASIRAAVAADPATGHCDWTVSLLTASRPL